MLVKCKTCGHEISHNAKTCPNCGEKHPVPIPKGCLQIILAIIIIMGLIGFCSSDDKVGYTKGTVQDYSEMLIDDVSIPNRKRAKVFIYSKANTLEDRAATVIDAAIKYQNEYGFDTVSIIMRCENVLESGTCAYANYTPDRKGNSGEDKSEKWVVQSSAEIPSELQEQTSKLWYQNRDRFIESKLITFPNGNSFMDDNHLNEDALKNFIANRLEVNKEQLSMAYYSLETVYEQ
ncbi:DUF4875 domain-containing protein [Geovibrio ferrireducens]|uniref:DUF4875 domain-containing protein n=1 Tax=Geovibrio ferrireducens TaxID=46201 RepID=UPI00224830A8|nr:hypothetical protein [Geovibrio ferrireducens]